MFNETNVDNRLRRLVRGRVIVATTSLCVEYLSEQLTQSMPLYSLDDLPTGKLLVFCVELHGHLTFNKGSEVKIIELSPFVAGYFDPTAFALVSPADALYDTVAGITFRYGQLATNYVESIVITVLSYTTGITYQVVLMAKNYAIPSADVARLASEVFAKGSQWRGSEYYPNLTLFVEND